MKKAFGFSLGFLFFNALLFYIGWNGWVWLETTFSLSSSFSYWMIFILLNYGYILAKGCNWLFPLRIVGACWLAVIQYSLILLPLINFIIWILLSNGFERDSVITKSGLLFIALLTVLFLYGLFNAYQPIVQNYNIVIPKKNGNRKNLRIAMASDMHFGVLSGKNHLKRMVKLVNKINPDIILFPGDIIDDEPFPFMKKNMGNIMKEMRAPLGIFATLGNHEYYGNRIPEFLEEMKRIGVCVLMDETVQLEDAFYLVGRKDKHDYERSTFSSLLDALDKNQPIIAMDHQPTEISIAAELGVDLLLSGHTHRGQMFPNHLITQNLFENDYGYYKKSQLHSIVSSGFGFWGPPIRIGSRSEVIQIDIAFTG